MYIATELLFLFFILLVKIFFSTQTNLLNVLTFLPILTTALYTSKYRHQIEKGSKILYVAILFAIFGDLFLIYINNVYGIFFFFLSQICYYLYLTDYKNKEGIALLTTINFICCTILKENMLFLEAFVYAVVSIVTCVISTKKVRKRKIPFAYYISFVFLYICDTNLFLLSCISEFRLSVDTTFFYVLEWISYISFQILICTSIIHRLPKKIEDIINRVNKKFLFYEERWKEKHTF